MIGTNEMSSTSMDISESFRPEDLVKADFFDFVTAPDMGIGIGVGVGVSMVGLQHHSHQHNNAHDRTTNVTLTHDSAGVGVGVGVGAGNDRVTIVNGNTNNNNNETGNANNNSNINNSNNNNNDNNQRNGNNAENSNNNNPHNNNSTNSNNSDTHTTTSNSNNNNNNNDATLQGYEFWNADKDPNRLESTIFEDLDRYCWQQHQHQQQQQQQQQPSANQQIQTSVPTASHPAHLNTSSPNQQRTHDGNTTASSTNTSATSTSGSISQPGSSGSLDNTDGQIYTLTVLNGSESWLKRESDSQLGGSLDLDSLLANFPGYIKSEYPYDESGFSSDANKNPNRADPNGLDIPEVLPQHSISSNILSSQNLPPLISALSVPTGVAGSTEICNANTLHLNQQLAQFQNNNNDWHMADHNAEQNSAESLLRSALQGKGYAKGLNIQNGMSLMPSSPSVKDDEMRRILYSTEAEALGFADSTLNTAPIFDDHQNPSHNAHIGNGPGLNNGPSNPNSMIVDDMFLSLENVFNDDFEKIKRIANEVQQYCNAPPDYTNTANDVMMQISPTATTSTAVNLAGANGNNQIPVQLQQTLTQSLPTSTTASINLQQQRAQQQQLKSESVVSTSSSVTPTANRLITPKINKKYKRSTSTSTPSNNNNNNPNVINNNNSNLNGNTVPLKTTGNISSGGSNSSNSSNSPTQCNGQRKERSLHYCSICSKGFKDKYSVNVHIRTHTGEKPFACSLCGKSFRQKAHLAKHYQTHMAQKNNGNLVKGSGSNSKHQRHQHASTTNGPTSMTPTATHRNLLNPGAVTSSTMNNVSTAVANNSRGLEVLGVGVPNLNSPITAPTRNVLPSANGLLANR